MNEALPRPRTSVKAVVCLLLGLAAPFSVGATSLPALFLGWVAVRQINISDGRLRGRRAAFLGMILAVVGIGLFFLGLVVVGLAHHRDVSNEVVCRNNLRRIGHAITVYYTDRQEFPPGTILVEGLPPEQRLSWLAAILPYMEGQSVAISSTRFADRKGRGLFDQLDAGRGWEAEANRTVVNTSLAWFACPHDGRRVGAGLPGQTNYVGIGGLGVGAAELPASDGRAGFFGYNRRITEADITRGLSQTMTATETTDRGAWAAGGSATVREVDPARQPYIGTGRPFGGLHAKGTLTLFADGRVDLINANVNPDVWEAHATIRAEP